MSGEAEQSEPGTGALGSHRLEYTNIKGRGAATDAQEEPDSPVLKASP